MVSRRTVAVAPGVELSVLVREARPDTRAFVLVHGLASNARLWDGVGSRLAELGHASVAVDQRGHGSSSKPDHGYDFETVTDDLAAVIEQALGRPAVLAGQSWGGNVVVEFARRHPDLVSGIVCVDGGFIQLADAFPVWDDARAALATLDIFEQDSVIENNLELARVMAEATDHLNHHPHVGQVRQTGMVLAVEMVSFQLLFASIGAYLLGRPLSKGAGPPAPPPRSAGSRRACPRAGRTTGRPRADVRRGTGWRARFGCVAAAGRWRPPAAVRRTPENGVGR